MTINPFTLKFVGENEDLEQGFLDHFFNQSLAIFRWGFFLGIVLYGLFAFLDALAMPEVKKELWKIRFFFVIPVMLAGIAFSFYGNFRRYWQITIAFIIVVAALGIFWMVVISKGPYKYTYYVGNILVMFFGMTFIRARFIWAFSFGLLIICMFEITHIFLIKTAMPMLLISNFFFCTAWLIGAVACYSLEYFARKNYYLMMLLEKEKSHLNEVNKLLKRQFDELKKAKEDVKRLSGLIPICANCKKVRDDKGYWNQIESYIAEHSDANFSHAICPSCIKKLYGSEKWFNSSKNSPQSE